MKENLAEDGKITIGKLPLSDHHAELIARLLFIKTGDDNILINRKLGYLNEFIFNVM